MRTADCPVCDLVTPVLEMAPNDVVLTEHIDETGKPCAGRGRTVPPGEVHDLIYDAGLGG